MSAYSIDPATAQLKLINQKPSSGGDPSYMSLDRTGHYVLVANFASGNVAVWALAPDGSLAERTAFVQHAASGENPQQPLQPHAHSIRVDPSNRFALVGDTGLDRLFVYQFNVKDGSLTPHDPPFVKAAPGANPRHVAFHPNRRWLYVLTEAGSTIILFNWDARRGALSEVQTVSTLPKDFQGKSACAEIEVHPSGKFGYASNHDSHTAMVFRIDQQTGKLTPMGQPVDVPSPYCPRFLAR